jgi:adenosylcobinamide-GDP ribazoletransferase
VFKEVMNLRKSFTFLSILPVDSKPQFSSGDFKSAITGFPLVGAAFGIILVGSFWLAKLILPVPVAAVIVIAVWITLSGGLHLDGLADSVDGWFGGSNTQEKLKIMDDSSIGSFGVMAIILDVLLKYVATVSLAIHIWPALFLTPLLGRFAVAYASTIGVPAKSHGLGKAVIEASGYRQLLLATTLTIVAGVAAFPTFKLMILLVAGWLATQIVVSFSLKQIGGLTGDILGAIIELVELTVLLTFLVFGS